jgi:uncharacterized membrane protein
MNDRRTTIVLKGVRPLIAAAFLAATMAFQPSPAAADFRLCNNTGSRVGIALGYKENDGWTTEGWWNLSARSCETLLRGPLVGPGFHVHARQGVHHSRY